MADSPRLFPTTSRTLVASFKSADPKTRELSLARFCALYYPALYGYARSLGLSQPDAQDRVQDFFVKVVRDDLLTQFNTEHGSRLSSWLTKCFKNMDLSQRAAEGSIKRGGGRVFVEFDPAHAEHSYLAAHMAHLEAAPTFDLMLAREIWSAAKAAILSEQQDKAKKALVTDLLAFVLMDRWPPHPMPTQEELAQRHKTTAVRVKAFYNRTLKVKMRRIFDQEAEAAHANIPEPEVNHLWHLLCRYGEI